MTIYLHRHQAHRALTLHPIISHFFRFWLWLTTGLITKQWAAIHRKHHAFSDKPGDPHSPQIFGIKKLLLGGAELYQNEAKNAETMEKYGMGTPDDWLERNVYAKHSNLGIAIMGVIDVILFGPIGLSIWAMQMLWIPVTAAGIINGLGHFIGYRNFECPDKATNLLPFGILIGGEELHNNHHTFATSAKLSSKWYEFDIGFFWIKMFSYLKLAKITRTIPIMQMHKRAQIDSLTLDLHSLETIIANRYHLMAKYAKLLKHDCKSELRRLQNTLEETISWRKVKRLLARDGSLLTQNEQSTVMKMIEHSPLLQKIFALREELAMLWQRSNLSREELLTKLHNWCVAAESSGIAKLSTFSLRLKTIY